MGETEGKVNDPVIYDYAVRYCMGRSSYAFGDGLEIAEAHWDELAPSTRLDVIDAVKGWAASQFDAPRYPTIAAARHRGRTW